MMGTLDKRATDIYNSCDEAQQLTIQHIFQQLTQLGEGIEDTRRRVSPWTFSPLMNQISKDSKILMLAEIQSETTDTGLNE